MAKNNHPNSKKNARRLRALARVEAFAALNAQEKQLQMMYNRDEYHRITGRPMAESRVRTANV